MRKRIAVMGRNEFDGSLAYYCFDFDVKFNKRGNIEVVIESTPRYFVSFFRMPIKYVFCRRSGVCLSHTPSKRYRYHKFNAQLVASHT